MKSPIIIVGAARSGTKFLRDVLASGSGTRAVPYDVNYVWRYGVGWQSDDRLTPDRLTEKQAEFIRRSLSSIARLRDGETLIEKTVATTLRVPYVDAVFPDARYIHLVRDGRDVVESAMRQWVAPPDWRALWTKLRGMPLRNLDYALWFAGNAIRGLGAGRKGGKIWGPRYPGIDRDSLSRPLVELCALQWKNSVVLARDGLAGIPEERVFEIRYEDLIASPDALDQLVAALSLPDRGTIIASYRSRVNPGDGGRWKRLSGAERERMAAIIDPTLRELGYPVP